MKGILWIICLILTMTSCSSSGNTIFPSNIQLKPGDVVFRRGGGFTSHVVIAADRKGRYSHVGIVVDSANHPMIVHSVPGEPDFKGDPDRVKMETPERFFIDMNASEGEVCRPADSVIARKAAIIALGKYRQHILFDHDYDSRDTTKMYCTELVAFAFARAGHPIVGPPTHEINLPGIKTACWLPSDIHDSPFLKTIITF